MRENTVMQKSLAFSIRIVNLNKYLCSQKNEYVMSKQICKSGTSIGCNCYTKQSISQIRNSPVFMTIWWKS